MPPDLAERDLADGRQRVGVGPVPAANQHTPPIPAAVEPVRHSGILERDHRTEFPVRIEPRLMAIEAALPIGELDLVPQQIVKLNIPIFATFRKLRLDDQRLSGLIIVDATPIFLRPFGTVADVLKSGQLHPVEADLLAHAFLITEHEAGKAFDEAAEQQVEATADVGGSRPRLERRTVEPFDREAPLLFPTPVIG